MSGIALHTRKPQLGGTATVAVKDANCQPICVPCVPEEAGSGGGSGSGGEEPGITLPCCPVPIPRQLHATIFIVGGTGSWDGITVTLNYGVDLTFPTYWYGVHAGDPCANGAGGPPYWLSVHFLHRGDLDLGPPPCRWQLILTDLSTGASWCRPDGSAADDTFYTDKSCDPMNVQFSGPYPFSGAGGTCGPCGLTAVNAFVVVTV